MKCAPFGCSELAVCLTNITLQEFWAPSIKAIESGLCPPGACAWGGCRYTGIPACRSQITLRETLTRVVLCISSSPLETSLRNTWVFSLNTPGKRQRASVVLGLIVGFWWRHFQVWSPVWLSACFLHLSRASFTLGVIIEKDSREKRSVSEHSEMQTMKHTVELFLP